MNIYEVYPVSGGEPCWDKLPKAQIANAQWLDAGDIRAWAQLCYDENNLYLRMEAEGEQILKRYTGENDPVCTDSCLEFFFASREEGNRYFNMEVNPNGACYFGYGRLRHQRARLLCKNPRELFAIRPFETEKGWGILVTFPLWYLEMFSPDFALYPGKKLRANFYKCAEDSATPHFLTWNPVQTPEPDYHQPGYFGQLIFK